MGLSSVLVLQNNPNETLGTLETLLRNDNYSITTLCAWRDDIPKNNYDMLIILGAPQNANDSLFYLGEEIDLIRIYTKLEKPVLGICLGSQLAARAFDSKVYRGKSLEFGYYDNLHPTPLGKRTLFAEFDDPFVVFHWHHDTFDLPIGANLLASSQIYPNQAFQLGSMVGIQFHLEADIPLVQKWLDRNLKPSEKIFAEKLKLNMNKFYENFMSLYH